MRLSRLSLSHYKSFSKFSLSFGHDAFLVGPNNAGKSTLIEAIRVGAGMFRVATRRRPEYPTQWGGERVWVYGLNASVLGLETENLRHQFRGAEATLRLDLDSGVIVQAVWPELDEENEPAEPPFFFVRRKDEYFTGRRPETFRGAAGIIGVIPTLRPIQHEEEVLEREYVERYAGSPRTAQHFRNHIYNIYRDGEFDEFREWILGELSEIDHLTIDTRPGRLPGRTELDVFYREHNERSDREVCWSGDGLQIYLQVLTHLWRLRQADVVVLDEPDVFLHADLQRRLVRFLEALPAQTITATHSPEMLGEASHEAVIWVDKSRTHAVRRPDAASMEDLSTKIGSQFNLKLATALRSKVVLFVEGQDMGLIKRLAKTLGARRLASEIGCSVIGMQGFDRWLHVEPFQWLLQEFLSDAVQVFVILDRDFRLDNEISDIVARLAAINVVGHVWQRKELESYLIEPGPLSRLSGLTTTELNQLLASITNSMINDATGQFIASFQRVHGGKRESVATVVQKAVHEFTPLMSDPEWRLRRLAPKEILATLNRELQDRGLKAISTQRVATALRRSEIASEMGDTIGQVEQALSR